MALVLFDMCRQQQSGLSRRIPSGVLVGLAATIKLTPALFIVCLIVSRQKRAALGSSLAAVGATLFAFLVYPDMSWDFITHVLWNLSDRVSLDGFFATSGNNSIHGALAAVGKWRSFPALLLAVCLAALGLYAAVGVHRRGKTTQAVILVGLTACVVSPVSWMHHWVYLLPAIIILWREGGPKTRAFCYSSGAILTATGPNLGDVLLDLEQPLLLPLAI